MAQNALTCNALGVGVFGLTCPNDVKAQCSVLWTGEKIKFDTFCVHCSELDLERIPWRKKETL